MPRRAELVMSSKHGKAEINYDKPYEENEVGMKGIVGFGIGLFLLIVITFGLMWLLLDVMEKDAKETKDRKHPLALSETEKLPAEPRLQAAPGFGVNGPNGRINLELKDPRSEWWELEKIWKDEWQNGRFSVAEDGKTKTKLSLSIKEAKEKLLASPPKARSTEDGAKALTESQTIISASSSGRTRSDRLR